MSPTPSEANPSTPARRDGLLAVLLVATVLLAYGPALSGGLLMDDADLIPSPDLQSLNGLWRIWTEPGATQQYYPLLHTAFWIQHKLWGAATPGYHLVNVLLHAACAGLLVPLTRRLALPGAWFAAFLFALHPVAVESAAWIAEQKNTLSTACFLAAALAWLRFDTTRRPAHYVLATACFAAALLSKSATVTLPPALLVLQWWRHGRLDWRADIRPLLPWFALAVAMGLLTIWVERAHIGATGPEFELGLLERLQLAGRALVFYPAKLLWPAGLLFMYPRWTPDAASAAHYLPLLAVLIFTASLCLHARKNRGPLAVWLLFAGTLFPVLGFLDIYWFVYSYVADHFVYLSAPALLVPLAALATRASNRLPPALRAATPFAALALLTLLGALTWRQSRLYRDYDALGAATLARNPGAWLFHNNTGVRHAEAGDIEAARERFAEAIRLRPAFGEGHFNLARACARLGDLETARVHATEAVRLEPTFPEARLLLGLLLAEDPATTREAIPHLREAVRLQASHAPAWHALGQALHHTGATAEALDAFETALAHEPAFLEAHFHRALLLAELPGRRAEALALLREITKAVPDFAPAHEALEQLTEE